MRPEKGDGRSLNGAKSTEVRALGCGFAPIWKKFKSEPQNARLPCEALCSVTVAVILIGMANLLEISLRA